MPHNDIVGVNEVHISLELLLRRVLIFLLLNDFVGLLIA